MLIKQHISSYCKNGCRNPVNCKWNIPVKWLTVESSLIYPIILKYLVICITKHNLLQLLLLLLLLRRRLLHLAHLHLLNTHQRLRKKALAIKRL